MIPFLKFVSKICLCLKVNVGIEDLLYKRLFVILLGYLNDILQNSKTPKTEISMQMLSKHKKKKKNNFFYIFLFLCLLGKLMTAVTVTRQYHLHREILHRTQRILHMSVRGFSKYLDSQLRTQSELRIWHIFECVSVT